MCFLFSLLTFSAIAFVSLCNSFERVTGQAVSGATFSIREAFEDSISALMVLFFCIVYQPINHWAQRDQILGYIIYLEVIHYLCLQNVLTREVCFRFFINQRYWCCRTLLIVCRMNTFLQPKIHSAASGGIICEPRINAAIHFHAANTALVRDVDLPEEGSLY